MTDKVLVAFDGSAGGTRALHYAAERAKVDGTRLVIAYVIDWSPYTFNTPEENATRHVHRQEEIERATSSIVGPAQAQMEAEHVECEAVVRHGKPAETLIRLSGEYDARQIVVGRRGQSKLKNLIFGSVSGKLVQTSPIPVVVVP
jgi:nucleotide-binding universal stress UspA family protein